MNALDTLPAGVGAGLKPMHVDEILAGGHGVDFFEIHAENYMVDGGPFHRHLQAVRDRYALSVHGVGLSIGGQEAPDTSHLVRLRQLLDRYQPQQFSEHLAWSSHGPWHFNDLLPIAYNHQTLQRVCHHVDLVQDALGRRMLLENPSTYVQHTNSCLHETDFLAEVLAKTGCGLLLDVNNVFVSCVNHGEDPAEWMNRMLDGLADDAVGEIHLAGHAVDVDAAGDPLLIDNHGSPVADAVWQLYEKTLRRLQRPVPTLIEWDNHVPAWRRLLAEAERARDVQQKLADTALHC